MEHDDRIAVAVLHDVPSWAGVLAGGALCAGALFVHYNHFAIWNVLVVMAWSYLGWMSLTLAWGSRSVFIFEDEIRVERRRRERLRQKLADLIHIEPLFHGLMILKFRDGGSLWWTFGGGDGDAAANHLQQKLIANRTTRPGARP